jgi:hypothetical protein
LRFVDAHRELRLVLFSAAHKITPEYRIRSILNRRLHLQGLGGLDGQQNHIGPGHVATPSVVQAGLLFPEFRQQRTSLGVTGGIASLRVASQAITADVTFSTEPSCFGGSKPDRSEMNLP